MISGSGCHSGQITCWDNLTGAIRWNFFLPLNPTATSSSTQAYGSDTSYRTTPKSLENGDLQGKTGQPGPNCIKHFHWTVRLFWPIRFDFTIVSTGNKCNVKPDWPESPQETVVKSNLISQYHPVNQENPLYNWVQSGQFLHIKSPLLLSNSRLTLIDNGSL